MAEDIELDETIVPSTSSAPGASSGPVKVKSNPPPSTSAADHVALRTVAATDYAVGDEIARGGMGRIRKARDLRLGRPVAVKELLATDPAAAERFEREIRLTARLQHPAIVSIYEAGRWDSGEPFYAMRMVPGQGLDAVVKPLTTLRERLALLPSVIAIVDALAYAHDQRIIHRDLKPGNVLIGPFGETVVIDWGLAKDLADEAAPASLREQVPPSSPPSSPPTTSDLTLVGSVMGTPAYMPPEQAMGEAVDERADVYALGAILYHVLAGRPPFVARRSDELLVKVLSKKPAALAGIDKDIPHDLITIVETAMARTPSERYASARELAADLRRFHTGQLVGAHQYSWWALVRRWIARHRAAVSVGALALVTLGVVATVLVRDIVRERDRAEAATTQAQAERAAAVTAKEKAVIAAARLHFDQGRQELLAGNPLRAAVLGREALVGEDTPATRLLVGLALRSLEPIARRFEGLSEPIYAAGFTHNGTRVFGATWLGKVRFWDAASGAQTLAFERPGKLGGAGMSPDGTTFVVLGEESVLELWDIANGTQRGTITIPGGVASRAEFSPDGTTLAIAGDALTLWSVATLAQLATGPALDTDDLTTVVRWTADGKRLVLASASGAISILDAATLRPLARIAAGKEVRDCSLAPDGARLAYITPDGGGIVDARSGRALAALDGTDAQRANQYVGVEWNPQGTLLALSTVGGNAKLVAADTGRTRRLFGDSSSLSFSPSGALLLAYGQATGRVRLYEPSGRLVNQLAGHAHAVASAAFSPDGNSVLTASDDGSIVRWNVAADASERRTPLVQRSRSAVFSTSGELLVTGGDDGTADVYAARTHARQRRFGTASDVPADPQIELLDGRVLTVLGVQKQVELWDLVGGARLVGFTASAPIKRAGTAANHALVWAATHTALTLWDATSGAERAAFPHVEPEGDPPELLGHHAAATVTPDGTRALVPATGGIAVIDIASKQQLGTLPIAGDVWSTIVDGDRAIVIATGSTVLFDLTTRRALATLVARGELVMDARFAGTAIYTQGTDGTVRRWDRTTGALAVSLEAESDGALLFAVAPDGSLVATLADDHVRLWDPRSGRMLADRDIALGGAATLLAFSPAGALVASGYAGTLWTWTLPAWRGSLAELDARMACEVPWQLVDGVIAPRARRCD